MVFVVSGRGQTPLVQSGQRFSGPGRIIESVLPGYTGYRMVALAERIHPIGPSVGIAVIGCLDKRGVLLVSDFVFAD